ncbi:MAG: DUF5977 domain-containing protein [Paludibacter sp.]|nr:DUF5977 domain-containing protein [Paludibacter sp.]
MRKQCVLILALFLCSAATFGQEQFGRATPQVTDFIRYGDIPVNLYEGKINISIPIFEIPDKDFPFSISLAYTSGGFRPNVRAGLVGLDWRLEYGGVITREVYGAPDDNRGNQNDQNIIAKGFWRAIKDPPHIIYDKDAVYNMEYPPIESNASIPSFQLPLIDNGKLHDYEPDLFEFKFGSHQGTFMIANDGSIKTNQAGYKVNLDSLLAQRTGAQDPVSSKIIITSPDGYIWEFGGKLSNMEISFPIDLYYGTLQEGTNQTVMAWYLSKVTAPNGRIMNINYENNEPNDPDSITSDNALLSLRSTYPYYQSTFLAWKNYLHDEMAIVNKMVIPKSITIDDTGLTILFKKSIENTLKSFLTQNTNYRFNGNTFQLDTIIINQLGETKKFELSYTNMDNMGNKGRRRFLKTFQQQGLQPYIFDYNPVQDVPPETKNGSIPFYEYWNKDDYAYTVNVYAGQLLKITYPTGGCTTFEYEYNEYRKRVETQVFPSSHIMPETNMVTLGNDEKTVGCRISRISNFENENTNNPLSDIQYKYVMNYDKNINLNTAKSSGTLLHYPFYSCNAYGNTYDWDNNVWQKNYNIGEPHIGYEEVAEVHSDGSYIIHKFSSYQWNKDSKEIKIKSVPNYSNSLNPEDIIVANISAVTSRAYLRGHLLNRIFYDKDGIAVKEDRFAYKDVRTMPVLSSPQDDDDAIQEDDNDCIVSFQSCIGGGATKKIYLKNCLPTYSIEIMKYEDNDTVKRTDFRYNNYDLIKESNMVDSRSDTVKTKYLYPFDMTSNSIYSQMSEKNMLNYPVEISQYKTSPNTDPIFVQKQINDYQQYDNKFAVEKEWLQTGNSNPWIVRSFEYDNSKLNPVTISNNETDITTYLWGYKNQYPIAEINNATYEQVKTALGYTDTQVESLAAQSNPDVENIGNLLRTNLQNSLVTTYTYRPLAGMATMINPQGITTFYDYDAFGRLRYIYDNEHQKVSEFEYSDGKFYNKEQSKCFVKTNCPEGCLNALYYYTVPANRYYSFDSQSDADAQALNDINANGQNAAEQYGECKYVTGIIRDPNNYSSTIGNYTAPSPTVIRIDMSLYFDSGQLWTGDKIVGVLDGNWLPAEVVTATAWADLLEVPYGGSTSPVLMYLKIDTSGNISAKSSSNNKCGGISFFANFDINISCSNTSN